MQHHAYGSIPGDRDEMTEDMMLLKLVNKDISIDKSPTDWSKGHTHEHGWPLNMYCPGWLPSSSTSAYAGTTTPIAPFYHTSMNSLDLSIS
jgi:hypothetical protein